MNLLTKLSPPTLLLCPIITLAQITETKLVSSNGEEDDRFGWSVSASGDYAVIGMANGLIDSSFAYIYRRDGASWVEEVTLGTGDVEDRFGQAVSISGDHVVVGAYDEREAYIFRREGTDWIIETRLTGIGPNFGEAVAISGDVVVVGPGVVGVGEAGYASVYRRDGTAWIQEATLTPSDGERFDQFASSIAVFGDYVLVGASWDDDNGSESGSAYVFKREGAGWVQEAKLLPDDGAPLDVFGYSVSLADDYAVVGASNDDDLGLSSGSAYVFRRDGTNWIQEAKLTASDGEANAYFGRTVSTSGDYLAIGADLDGAGAAYLFRREGIGWVEEMKLVASDGEDGDRFGYSVAISGDDIVVGAMGDNDNGVSSGSAYIYSGFLPTACDDYTDFLTRCGEGSTVKVRVVLLDNIDHSGETVLFQIDSITYPATVVDNGISSRASISIPGLGAGPHTVSVLDPVGCFTPRVVTCGPEKADPEWDENEKRWAAETVSTRTPDVPPDTKLLGNHPNPFNPTTAVSYQLSADSWVTLRVYNTLGEEVTTLVNEFQGTGIKSVVWDGRTSSGSPVASGIYIYRLAAGNVAKSGRMLLLK